MSGTVDMFAPQAGAERIIGSSAPTIRILKKVFRIAALVAAIFFLAVFVPATASFAPQSPAPVLFGCD